MANSKENSKESLEMYWKRNIKILAVLLSIWFIVSYVLGIMIEWSGRFWMAQQGSIYIFVILIFVYVKMMNNLDKEFDVEEEEKK